MTTAQLSHEIYWLSGHIVFIAFVKYQSGIYFGAEISVNLLNLLSRVCDTRIWETVSHT